jgi:hypothetical protein
LSSETRRMWYQIGAKMRQSGTKICTAASIRRQRKVLTPATRNASLPRLDLHQQVD